MSEMSISLSLSLVHNVRQHNLCCQAVAVEREAFWSKVFFLNEPFSASFLFLSLEQLSENICSI